MVIDRNSFFGGVYVSYQQLMGEKEEVYHDNFCHFCRVVIFWAPLGFFFGYKIFKFLRPWMFYILAITIAPFYIESLTLFTIAVCSYILLLIFCFLWLSTKITESGIYVWFFTKRYAPLVHPWTIFVFLMHGLYFIDKKMFLYWIRFELLVASAFLFIILLGLIVVDVLLISRELKKVPGIKNEANLILIYLKTKKQKICPSVEIK